MEGSENTNCEDRRSKGLDHCRTLPRRLQLDQSDLRLGYDSVGNVSKTTQNSLLWKNNRENITPCKFSVSSAIPNPSEVFPGSVLLLNSVRWMKTPSRAVSIRHRHTLCAPLRALPWPRYRSNEMDVAQCFRLRAQVRRHWPKGQRSCCENR